MRILVVMGTRPEAIKLWPVITELGRCGVDTIICDTGQQRDLLDQTFPVLGLVPDISLDLMAPGLNPEALADIMADRLVGVFRHCRPDWVVVQGDTASALAGAVAARRAGVALAHVEAGLRTFDLAAPWPEENNRREIARFANHHFAPTPRAAANLLSEGVDETAIDITGNTGVDALRTMRSRLNTEAVLASSARAEIFSIGSDKRLIVVTAHRRENFAALGQLADSLSTLARRKDAQVVVTAHPNPATGPFISRLAAQAGLEILPPLSYPAFLLLMERAALLVTDSGGLQEEAPSFGLPTLVTRVSTERQEAIEAGAAQLVSPDSLCAAASRLLDDTSAYVAMAKIRSPFGDGHAAKRIVHTLLNPGAVLGIKIC